MANTNLTVDMITREALRVLHQKFTFAGRINRQYDDQFARSGAKIGDTLRIRLPNEFTVRTGRPIAVQDVVEQNTTLTVATQKGVDINFTSEELTLDIDDFSERYLRPAMSVLAANIEGPMLQDVTKDVYNLVDDGGAAIDLQTILLGKKQMVDNLAPSDGTWTSLLETSHSATLVDSLKGLFHDSAAVSQQYREGMMGRTAGYDFFESTHVVDHTTGTSTEGDSGRNINGAGQTGSAITIDTTGGLTFLRGDIVTLAGCTRVHPETKISTGEAQKFVVTADCGASATTLNISPAIVISGARQNVTAAPTNSGAVTKLAAGANGTLSSSLLFQRDAFTLATADLIMPDGVHFASRQNFDGIAMRIVRQYDINNDQIPCRIDVLYGYKTLRAQHAVRLNAD